MENVGLLNRQKLTNYTKWCPKRKEGYIMRRVLSKQITEIKPSGIRKFFDYAADMPQAISLGVGEPDFDTPMHVREVGIKALQEGKTFYTSNSGLKELRAGISEFLARKYDLHYDPMEEMLMTVGGSEGIDIAFRAMLDPGDEVLIPQPSYVSYDPCCTLAGGVTVPINLKAENEFRLTKKELEDSITPKTKILVMPFPNNPTGAIMTREDLEAIVPVIIENDLIVISDEIYSELTYGVEHVSIASLPGMRERTILINGFSKSHAMTGWRLGYACGPKEVISQMLKIHQFAIMCAPTVSQYAAVDAISNSDDDIAYMKVKYNERREFLLEKLRGMGFECFEPFGAFYMFPSIKSTGLSSEDFCMRLLKEEEVAVVPGTAFGDCGEGFVRISYAYSIEDLTKAMTRIEHFVKKVRKENI